MYLHKKTQNKKRNQRKNRNFPFDMLINVTEIM